MTELTRSRALRAAAKLAAGLALSACGGLENASTQADSGAISQDTSQHASSNAPLACNLATDADGGLLASEVQCCLDLTTAHAPADFDASAWQSDPSLNGCCEGLAQSPDLIAYEYGDAGGRAWPEEACQACAVAIDKPGACTPWGPPVPPSIPGEVAT